MLQLSQCRLLIIFFFISRVVLAQDSPPFKYRDECYTLLLEANTMLRTKKDTVGYGAIFNKIDSLTLSEENYSFYVKYLVLRGGLLSRYGYLNEGLNRIKKAIRLGNKYLPKNSPRIAVAHGNLGYTYNRMGEIDSFVHHSLISNKILLTNPAKNASNLIQTNFNLESYLVNDPDKLFEINEQTDSLIHYLTTKDYDVKANYHLRKSKRALVNKNFRKSKFHINKAIQYFNSAKEPKINFKKYYYGALAMHFYLTKNYEEAILNYTIYDGLIEDTGMYSARAYVNDQLSKCYVGLNEMDSALVYVYKAYENLKNNPIENRKLVSAYHALRVLKLNYLVNKTYDLKVFNELEEMADVLLIVPIHYLEYAKIKSRIKDDNNAFYKSVLLDNIKNTETNIFESYYVAKLAEFHFNNENISTADSLFNKAIHLNQVLPDKTNSLLYNIDLVKTFVEYKYKILTKNKAVYSDKEILERYDVLIKSLLTYVYENWDSVDRDEILEQIHFYSDEAIEFCYSKGKSIKNSDASDIPYFEYALYFSDQSNSILFKYHQRQLFALENSKFPADKLSKLHYYKSKLDAYFYGKVEEIDQDDLIKFQAIYNELLMEAQMSKSAFVETESFTDFRKHLAKIKSKYDDVYVFHTVKNSVYKLDVHSKQIHKLNRSKTEILHDEQVLFDAMVNHKTKEYEQRAYSLYQSLFASHVKNDSKNILIINAPDLLPIPFEGLVKSVNNKGFNKLDYLLWDYVFTYNQGLSADFDYQKNFDLSLPYIGIYSDKGNNLNYAKSEIEGVNKLLKGEVYHIDGNNKYTDLLERLKLAQIIHIATHNVIDSTNAYSTELVFGDSAANINMKYYEIMNMDINPNLLVLNACSTAEGEYKIGEGKISMARAFNYAGVQNVLVNAWDVSDFSVKTIMESFFKYYNKRKEVAKALQLSKQNYLKESDDLTGNPLFWGGTIFVSSSHVTSHNYLLTLGLGILLLSICFIGLAYFRSGSKG